MTLANCITNKAKSGLVSQIKGKKAADRHREISDALIKGGETPSIAYQLAADRVLDEVSFAAASQKRRLLADIETRAQINTAVDAAGPADLKWLATTMVDKTDFVARTLHRRANGQIGEFLKTHYPNLLGTLSKPLEFMEFLKAINGEATGNVAARGFADAVNHVNEYFRLELNKHGYNIGKLENWGLPHSHNALGIAKAGAQKWMADIKPLLDWSKMVDNATGKPFAATPPPAFQDEFLQNVFGNIVYGRNSKKAIWGRTNLKAGNPLEQHRVFAFKDTDAWVSYNKAYGSGTPLETVTQHIGAMSHELAMAKTFGRDHRMALDYMGQKITQKHRMLGLSEGDAKIAQGNLKHAERMVNVMSGGVGPDGKWGAASAKFFSTVRAVITSAVLDRAVIISVPSDINSTRMAAQAIGMNPSNVASTYVNLMAEELKGGGMLHDDLLRQGWIADSLASPGVSRSRFQEEMPAAEWAHVLSDASMRIQGLNAHTDNMRIAFQHGLSAHFASVSHLPFDKLPDVLQRDMWDRGGITAQDWDKFRSSGGEFTAGNGATFLNPLYWHKATNLGEEEADDLFIKMQSYVEQWTEFAVPTGSLIAKGVMDPKAYNLAPGGAAYELLKSAGMFKSIVGALVVNQVRMVNMTTQHMGMTGKAAKIAYLAELVATTTLVGAVGIQVGDMLLGRDPQPMDSDTFWWKALLRGGALGPVGDVLATGATSWGGGLPGYVAGPIPAVASDILKLTFGNVAQAYSQLQNGDDVDVNLIPELAKFISRYTPMGQTPLLAGGAALDRLILDQFQMALDPDSINGLLDANTRRKNLNGNDAWWMPGSPLPTRAPAFGGNP